MEKGPDKDDGLGSAAQQMRAAQPYLGAVWKMVGSAFVGVGGGYLLDRWLKTGPWFLLGLSTVSIGVGFYAFVREMLRLGKK